MDLTEQTGIDETFMNYSKEAIFTNGIHYEFRKHLGDWSFPFGIEGGEIETSRFYPDTDWLYPLPTFWNKKNEILNLRYIAELIEPITLIYFPAENETYLSTAKTQPDFLWDMALSYLRLGYLPPLWTCKIAVLPGMDLNQPELKIVALGCRKTLDIARSKVIGWQNELRYNILDHYEEINDDTRDSAGEGKGY